MLWLKKLSKLRQKLRYRSLAIAMSTNNAIEITDQYTPQSQSLNSGNKKIMVGRIQSIRFRINKSATFKPLEVFYISLAG